jgi:hypothetical protein
MSGKVGETRPFEAELDRIEAWLVENSRWLALGIVAAAFTLRLFYAYGCYLNPDEALHFSVARPSSWHGAYGASLWVSHPPLFILVLHGILFLGRTELVLRLPSLIGGTAALWFTFAWLRRSFGEVAALSGLVFMALSPVAISASTEVRQYGLLLCFVCGALYATERMFSDRSAGWAIVQGVLLVGALLTHYIALLVIAAIGVCVVLRLLSEGAPRRVLFTFVACQLVLAGALVWLYFSQVRTMLVPGGIIDMSYLRANYYLKGQETLLGFAWRMLSRTFGYAVGFRRLALIPLSLFVAGLVAIATGRTKAARLTAVLVVSPFVVGFAAGLLHVFPFAGSRHQAYLLPFLAAGISASLAWVDRRVAVCLLLAGVVIAAPLWVILAVPDNNRRILRKSDISEAIQYVHQMIPVGSTLFVDGSTRAELEYYLARNDQELDAARTKPMAEWLGGYRVVVPKHFVWLFLPDEVFEQVNESAQALHVPSGDSLWIFSTAWGPSLASRLPHGMDCEVKEFGRTSVIKMRLAEKGGAAPNGERVSGSRGCP